MEKVIIAVVTSVLSSMFGGEDREKRIVDETEPSAWVETFAEGNSEKEILNSFDPLEAGKK